MESFNQQDFSEIVGQNYSFIQDNHVCSRKDALRGLHYQREYPQGKLLRVLNGEIFDVCVDMRKSSETFGQYFSIKLSSLDKKMIWIPPGFAHGFLSLSQESEVSYKTTERRVIEDECVLRWDDPQIAINWPIQSDPILSLKDKAGKSLEEIIDANLLV